MLVVLVVRQEVVQVAQDVFQASLYQVAEVVPQEGDLADMVVLAPGEAVVYARLAAAVAAAVAQVISGLQVTQVQLVPLAQQATQAHLV